MVESLYLVAMIIGGGFVVVSAFAGGGGHDADGDHEIEVDPEGQAHPSSDTDLDTQRGARFRPLSSFKFWTFFAAFFGLTGFIFTKLSVAPIITLPTAIVMGAIFGLMVSGSLHRLSHRQTSSHVGIDRVVGNEGEVLVAVRGAVPGKVRILVGGRAVDYLAVSDVDERMEPGARVLIVAVSEQKIKVVPAERMFPEN